MKIRHVFLLMLACVSQVLAQETQGPAGSGLPERFKQLDRNADGKLTPQELPHEWFERLDTDRDGVVTLEEAKAALAAAGTGAAAAVATGRFSLAAHLSAQPQALCLAVSDWEAARRFYGEGLGLQQKPDPPGSVPGMAMHLFGIGQSTLKLRVYDEAPPKRDPAIAAANGIRFVSLPVASLTETGQRLQQQGFAAPTAVQQTGRKVGRTVDPDGYAVELREMGPGGPGDTDLEIGLIVADTQAADTFLAGALALEAAPPQGLPMLDGVAERCYRLGRFVLRVAAPPGERPTYEDRIPDALGFRYITTNVDDAGAVHDALAASDVTIASPLATHGGAVQLCMARGPGGALFEFVGAPGMGLAGANGTQQPAGQVPAQAQAVFKQVDRDGDGKLSPQELPNAERFKQMDRDGDGFVTLGEAAASLTAGATPRPVTGNEPEAHPPTDRPFLNFAFTTDYYAGSQPEGSPLRAATEANALALHNGMLYCATSYMPPGNNVAEVNPKILVKKSAHGPWELDFEAGSEFVRLGSLHSVTFTTDAQGHKLDRPVSVLIAGTGAWRSQPTGVVVFSRNDGTGKWTKSVLSPNRWNRERTNHTTEVRCIFDHIDRVTGVHYVFAGSATGRLFRGVYDRSQAGLIAWDAEPELGDLVGHFLCAAEADGVQYVGVAYGPTKEDVRQVTERPVQDHGLFRRVDGPDAHWECVPVPEWEDPQQAGRSLRTAQLRGMTAVPSPDGTHEDLLIAWDSRDAVIERIDPTNGHHATVELDVRGYLAEHWGRHMGISTFAYNDMLPVKDPRTGQQAWLIGLWVVYPEGEGNELGKSSWYLVRYADGEYRYGRIWDPGNPLTDSPYGLRGCRSIRPSPFPEEAGKVWYFCGFDQTGATGRTGARGATAWIYKATLPEQ